MSKRFEPDEVVPAGWRPGTGDPYSDPWTADGGSPVHDIGWSEAPPSVRVLFWALTAQAVALFCGGFYGFFVSLDQPSTGSGIREFAVLVWFVIMLMGMGCLGVALGVRRRRAVAVTVAALMELPTVVLLPVALWNVVSHFTIEATPILVPLLVGLVALVSALHPGTGRWVRAR